MTNQKCFNPIESSDMKFKFRIYLIARRYIPLKIHKQVENCVAIIFQIRKPWKSISMVQFEISSSKIFVELYDIVWCIWKAILQSFNRSDKSNIKKVMVNKSK